MEITLPYNWKPRAYQLPVMNYMLPDKPGLRACCLWHRRAGKDLTAVNIAAIKAMQRTGTYWHLLPYFNQGRDIVWEGMTRDGRRFIDHFPPQMVAHTSNLEMKLELVNGSIWRVMGADNLDRLIGTNPLGVVFSEFSVHAYFKEVWDYLRPILRENGGWAVFIFTVRGRNHAWDLYEMARDNDDWFCELLSAGDSGTKNDDGTPVVPDAAIEEERRSGMPETMIQQEFYNSPDAGLVGSYYIDQVNRAVSEGRVRGVPYDEALEVHTAWDLGIRDYTAIWFWQEIGNEYRFIDYLEDSDRPMDHYIRAVREKPYLYGKHYAPHDIEVTEFGTGLSRKDRARKLGFRFVPVPKHAKADRVDRVRAVLSKCYFDVTKCRKGLDALRNFAKSYDRKRGVYRDIEEKNQWVHGADAFGIFAMSGSMPPDSRLGRRGQQTKVLDTWR